MRKLRKKRLFGMMLSVASLIFAATTTHAQQLYPHPVGVTHPDFTALDENNQPFQLSAQSGKVVVIHFCAFWCTPCRQSATIEGALIADINAQIGAGNWVFINALIQDNNGNPSTATNALDWKSLGNTPARTLHAEGNSNSALAILGQQIFAFPTYLIIDTKGRVATIFSGFSPAQTPGQITSGVIEAWESRPKTAPSPSSFSPGAPQLLSVNFIADTALDPSGGVVSSSESYTLKPGYAGQIYDVVSLSMPPDPAIVLEESTHMLSAQAIMDDETLLALDADFVAWSIVSGPVSSITPDGVAQTTSVYKNTDVTVQADAFGFSEELTFIVLDSLLDNFGSVAGDGIEDSWQFEFFDVDDNQILDETELANASPSANPDNDSSDNYTEWAGGFDPTNSLDFLKLEVLTKAGSTIHLRIPKVRAGTFYSVEKSTNLDFDSFPNPIEVHSENFTEAQSEFLPDSDITDFLLEDRDATQTRAFYRLQLERGL